MTDAKCEHHWEGPDPISGGFKCKNCGSIAFPLPMADASPLRGQTKKEKNNGTHELD